MLALPDGTLHLGGGSAYPRGFWVKGLGFGVLGLGFLGSYPRLQARMEDKIGLWISPGSALGVRVQVSSEGWETSGMQIGGSRLKALGRLGFMLKGSK